MARSFDAMDCFTIIQWCSCWSWGVGSRDSFDRFSWRLANSSPFRSVKIPDGRDVAVTYLHRIFALIVRLNIFLCSGHFMDDFLSRNRFVYYYLLRLPTLFNKPLHGKHSKVPWSAWSWVHAMHAWSSCHEAECSWSKVPIKIIPFGGYCKISIFRQFAYQINLANCRICFDLSTLFWKTIS